MTCRTALRNRPRTAVITEILTIHAFVSARRDPRRRRALVAMTGAALVVLLAWTSMRGDPPAAAGAMPAGPMVVAVTR